MPELESLGAMVSQKQLDANRRSALKSTGPRTAAGKRRSRHNAFRHGLTAVTVVDGLEDPRLYRAFQAAIISDYTPLFAVEHELVLRLTSLLWRLRRATAIESGLLEIHAGTMRDDKPEGTAAVTAAASDPYCQPGLIDKATHPLPTVPGSNSTHANRRSDRTHMRRRKGSRDVAAYYLRMENHTDGAFERFGRYEATLWRQARGIIAILEAMRSSPSKEPSRSLRNFTKPRDDFVPRRSNRLW